MPHPARGKKDERMDQNFEKAGSRVAFTPAGILIGGIGVAPAVSSIPFLSANTFSQIHYVTPAAEGTFIWPVETVIRFARYEKRG